MRRTKNPKSYKRKGIATLVVIHCCEQWNELESVVLGMKLLLLGVQYYAMRRNVAGADNSLAISNRLTGKLLRVEYS